MKRIAGMCALLLCAAALSGCRSEHFAMDACEWKLRTVLRGDLEAAQDDTLVVAVGEADARYPDAARVNITLTAADGALTVTDAANDTTYHGVYAMQQQTPDGTEYAVTIDGVSGYATVSETQYAGQPAVLTMPLRIGGYDLYFTANEQ